MNCSPSLLIKWLREFINNLKLDLDKAKNKLDKNIPDIIEMDEARRQGDESLLSITNEWLKARVFDEVPKRLQGARSTKQKNDRFTESF